MSYYGRSAESAFMSDHNKKMHMKTGDLLEQNFLSRIIQYIQKENASRKASGKDMKPIQVYPHRPHDANDKYRGTDLKIIDWDGQLAPFAGHIRLDVTHAFDKKDHMPLLATPSEPVEILPGMPPLRFGIRVGNENKAFDDPVVVIGMDADPKTVKSVEERGAYYTALSRKMPDILQTAGCTVQEYRRLTDPDYRAFLEKAGSDIPASGIELTAIKKGRNEVLNHKKAWYTEFGKTAKQLVSSALGSKLEPVGSPSGGKKTYIEMLNQSVAAADARDRKEQDEKDIREGIRR